MSSVSVSDECIAALTASVDKNVNFSSAAARRGSVPRLSSLFKDLQKILRPEVSYEIGAFEAEFSLDIKKMFPDIAAYAFEANPHNYSHWTRSNPELSSISYQHLAISHNDGTVTFSIQDKWKVTGRPFPKVRGNNSIMQRADPRIKYVEVTVPSKRLDTFAAENDLRGKSACAWIDVEGAQESVLTSATDVLRTDIDSILIEVEEHVFWERQWLKHQVLKYLEDLDFVCVARDFPDPRQHNILLVKRRRIPDVFEHLQTWHAQSTGESVGE